MINYVIMFLLLVRGLMLDKTSYILASGLFAIAGAIAHGFYQLFTEDDDE